VTIELIPLCTATVTLADPFHGRLDLSQGQGASPVYSAPLFETGDERYAWINKIQAVAKGELSVDGKRRVYEICEVR
jgi:hypothetical protein